MMTPFLAFYLTLMGGEGIPARTHAAAEQIAQNYGEGAAFVGLDLTPASGADSGVATTSWLSTTSAVWLFEEADSTDASDSGASTNDTMTDNGGVLKDTANFVEGAKSADTLLNVDYYSCTDANCPGIDPANGASFTWGCWVRLDTLPATTPEYVQRKIGTNTGYSSQFKGGDVGDPFRCEINLAADVVVLWNTSSMSIDTWYHAVCTNSDPGDITLTPYINAVADTATVQTASYATNNSVSNINFNSATQGFDGKVDECFFDNGAAWSAAEVASACSCEIDRSRCRCATADPTTYLPCDTNADCQLSGGDALCDTAAGAKDDTYCVEGSKAGCCMGRNATGTPNCGGAQLTACNATGP